MGGKKGNERGLHGAEDPVHPQWLAFDLCSCGQMDGKREIITQLVPRV